MNPLLRGQRPSRCVKAICRLARPSRTSSPVCPQHTATTIFTRSATTTRAGPKMTGPTDYTCWTKTGLVARIQHLETELQRLRPFAPEPQKQQLDEAADPNPETIKTKKQQKKMDPTRYSTRFIALKLAYLGKNYGGFEFQPRGTLSTVEEELWKALTKACLVFPAEGGDEEKVDFGTCEYSKCGRTDRGVSAFGQVVGLRVRSNRPLPRVKEEEGGEDSGQEGRQQQDGERGEEHEGEEGEEKETVKPFDPIADEIRYPMVLNRLLPPDIRVLAWCPSPPADFSARFSCRERQYRYFFTQPAFSPEPSSSSSSSSSIGGGGAWLDIEAMRDAAKRFEGEHDFRNFCKVNESKLIENWTRAIFESDIVEVPDVATALPYVSSADFSPAEVHAAAQKRRGGGGSDGGGKVEGGAAVFPKVYYFHVRGSAFLWHQIRHMVAVLFLVGQGLEKPSVVSELLDLSTYPTRPNYRMADEVPLVLWDCIFPDLTESSSSPPTSSSDQRFVDNLQWIYESSDESSQRRVGPFGPHSAVEGMWETWRERKMDELLAAQLLQQMAEQAKMCGGGKMCGGRRDGDGDGAKVRIFEGGTTGRLAGKYVPVARRGRIAAVEEVNDRYARRKGFVDAADMRAKQWADG